MKPCVTISLVPESRGGPFVYWDDLTFAIEQAAILGFAAVEIFAPSAESLRSLELEPRLSQAGLALAAVGTGAGWVKQRLTLTDADPARRREARDFIRAIIDAAGELGAPAIIGSMQGRSTEHVNRAAAQQFLVESLCELGEVAAQYHVPLLYEPLNRYETDLCNTLSDAINLLHRDQAAHVRLLADLFHMNIEERSTPDAIRSAAQWIGHVHFVDSNRQAAGRGHLDISAIAQALQDISYDRYLSAEAYPVPDSATAARATIETFRRHFVT
jgi:sugar phosphate isomerase/epimerase